MGTAEGIIYAVVWGAIACGKSRLNETVGFLIDEIDSSVIKVPKSIEQNIQCSMSEL